MVRKEDLERMAHADITKLAPETLPDLPGIRIEGETPAERLESYLAQTNNPYCFRVGDVPVKISFSGVEATLEDKLRKYFLGLKG